MTINALTAADEVIIAVNPQLLAMMGLQDFIRTVKKVRSRLNDRLQIAGILLTMCDARTNLCKVIIEQLTDTFDGQIRIFKSIIPNTVKVGESIYYSEPLREYAPENKACKAYRNLAEEVVGVWPCAEKRRQDKGISAYCSCGGKGCTDSGTGSGEGSEMMAGGESI